MTPVQQPQERSLLVLLLFSAFGVSAAGSGDSASGTQLLVGSGVVTSLSFCVLLPVAVLAAVVGYCVLSRCRDLCFGSPGGAGVRAGLNLAEQPGYNATAYSNVYLPMAAQVADSTIVPSASAPPNPFQVGANTFAQRAAGDHGTAAATSLFNGGQAANNVTLDVGGSSVLTQVTTAVGTVAQARTQVIGGLIGAVLKNN